VVQDLLGMSWSSGANRAILVRIFTLRFDAVLGGFDDGPLRSPGGPNDAPPNRRRQVRPTGDHPPQIGRHFLLHTCCTLRVHGTALELPRICAGRLSPRRASGGK
jgi:hypothetical protein